MKIENPDTTKREEGKRRGPIEKETEKPLVSYLYGDKGPALTGYSLRIQLRGGEKRNLRKGKKKHPQYKAIRDGKQLGAIKKDQRKCIRGKKGKATSPKRVRKIGG